MRSQRSATATSVCSSRTFSSPPKEALQKDLRKALSISGLTFPSFFTQGFTGVKTRGCLRIQRARVQQSQPLWAREHEEGTDRAWFLALMAASQRKTTPSPGTTELVHQPAVQDTNATALSRPAPSNT